MLGKLIKYEWKSLSRQFLVMLAILAGTTLVSSLIIVSINFEFDDVNENYSLFMLIGSVLIYYLGLIVCSIRTACQDGQASCQTGRNVTYKMIKCCALLCFI